MARERFFLELDPPDSSLKSLPHVVVVGGGFAGLKACHALIGKPVRVTLIDKRNFSLFQPLLYQVATGLVAEGDVASPLRQLVGQAANVQVLLGEVEEIDTQAKQIVFNDRQLAYDHLILAAGSGSSYFGHDEWREAAPPMKILEHADEIRRRVLLALEEAEQTPDPVRRAFLQSVVVVGGGPSGCELSGSLMELMAHALGRDFKQLDPRQCKVTLVDPGDRVLRAMDPSLSAAAGSYLQSAGVELLLGGRVQTIEAEKVVVNTSEGARTLEAATICWTAGVKASHLGQVLADASGCTVDRGGRVVVEPDFSIPGHPEIRVIGDLCSYSHTSDGKPLAGMAGPAVQMGGWVAADIVAKIQGRAHKAFQFTDFGTMAVLGPLHAVADLRGLKVSGLPGWILWGLAHLMFMPANENRLTLLTKWLWAIATRQRASMLITGRPNQHLNVEVGLERPLNAP
ncbi:NAD(P)/FAD-dependent oxidoreductase [Cyanobium sp. Maggiore-St4-Cus]|uniref:NAD(P)/FAD-dependent oxidoreductase n=1 Tax=Cyanobium sp. Maggiore-St4-Cus TaxID=2823717 RepID=UPI0020CD68FB|nr:NAD(P)/FAD-dependent oxidoreductase [Cyanobium sp. Maggiore-St4-Cus]MCF8141796.1 NAD(P)/FAD-dependent oxidoreductase [Cyanobium usitatum Tobar12.5m-G36]MCP9788634.1 NAD(P)/FAD-dependent oxidoreductase [Cyanobium sp. Maggiore-St4-Cus]